MQTKSDENRLFAGLRAIGAATTAVRTLFDQNGKAAADGVRWWWVQPRRVVSAGECRGVLGWCWRHEMAGCG
ncbi:uncharacterized protein CANTADRAFT_123001 [Suhomyces tanzawaensis NRRL Y-17324]|uniref:Uncharacterized protein n=1 Tax=Suhomyces tanzawaensis NRRL Y-17324 TaxID=984487 RepID=A0A1E4SQM1_9ASCO|nr:uncharacterized protein CANTADRAFT_123001 [Suhomyces tanzawaensis NRRL Y-17324]ODV81810.1 hypothetical protein CANTADRAFT_123001 [Suhomyces tanzawaensis NRRL Y-17324]